MGALLLLVAFGCGDDAPAPSDMSTELCAEGCDNGIFCDGQETCDPDDPLADARGCVSSEPPCGDMTCDEAGRMCELGCVDADGDGHQAASCGGDDCDDLNPDRFPGNPEVCDSAGLDEDCDPRTLGDDVDGDGFVSDECCNQQGDGLLRCGTDCDDSSSDVHPEVIDICGNGDQDCDGDIDEDPEQVLYRDFDNDGFGNADMADTIMACAATAGYVPLPTDCDDSRNDVSPNSAEQCDDGAMVDENCDGSFNEGCGCMPLSAERACGSATAQSGVGECRAGTQTCNAIPGGSGWGSCMGEVDSAPEICNGLDDDCNGAPDDAAGFACVQGSDPIVGTNACGRTGQRVCGPNCTFTTPDFATPENVGTCDYCADNGSLSEEAPFADQEVSVDWIGIEGLGAPDYERLGDASNFSTAMYLAGSSNNARDREGAWYLRDPLRVGYGSVTFEAEMRVVGAPTSSEGPLEGTGEGWAMVVVEESCTQRLGRSGNFLAVPRECNGFSVEMRFVALNDIRDPDDSIALRRLVATSSSDPVLGPPSTWAANRARDGATVDQRVRYTLTPDLPDTPANETSLSVEFVNYPPMFVQGPRCGFSGTPACGFRIRSGERYYFGLTGSTGSFTSSMHWESTSPTLETPELRIRGLCR